MARLVLLLAALVLALPASGLAAAGTDRDVSGVYQSVSDSGWDVTLVLTPEHIMVLIIEAWIPGRYHEREVTLLSGQWREQQDGYLLEYEGVSDFLRFDPDLSLAGIGLSGGHPGFEVVRAARASGLGRIRLYRIPHAFPAPETPSVSPIP